MTLPRFVPLVVLLPMFITTVTGGQNRTLQSFGVRVERGQPVYPLPSNVALGLFNLEDPLLDVAYYAEGKVQVFQNLGNGLFAEQPAYERRVAGEVTHMQWCVREMFYPSPSNLILTYADGREETLTHEQMMQQRRSFASLPQMTNSFPPLSFVEKWRSGPNPGLNYNVAVTDIDNDGRMEMIYYFPPAVGGDSLRRLVVYECVGDDSFVVDWDTTVITMGGLLGVTDLDNDGHKEIITGYMPRGINILPTMALLECYGPRRYRFHSTNIGVRRPVFAAMETDVDRNGVKELAVLGSDGSLSYDQTFIDIAEFYSKTWCTPGPLCPSGWTMTFNGGHFVRYQAYCFNMAIGQVDGTGIDEIVPGSGYFGYNEPVPIIYLKYNGIPGPFAWEVRGIYTGLRSGSTVPMFLNLDQDTTQELLIGGVGPIYHGSMFALKYLHDSTWTVLWADSSLLSSPLHVNKGVLDGVPVVAGANIWNPSLDTKFSHLHVYEPGGYRVGAWMLDSAGIQQFHLLDIDNDQRTNLVFAQTSMVAPHYLRVFERDSETDVTLPPEVPKVFALFQNYPNPFNPTTKIAFALPRWGVVSLAVFDVLGRQVRTLADDWFEQGNYIIPWDGTNDEGGDVSSGVYLYRLTVRGEAGTLFTSTKKMILLR